jgi:hypothetical protein
VVLSIEVSPSTIPRISCIVLISNGVILVSPSTNAVAYNALTYLRYFFAVVGSLIFPVFINNSLVSVVNKIEPTLL